MEEKKNVALKAEEDQKTAVESAYDYLEHFDILETITNVGNDEVFTPRKTCEMILDSLPEEVWHNPDYKWLNPATKNGIFEREIAIRLDAGLRDVIPDEEARRKHILQHMIYAIGQTKFTSYVARRTLYYCSDANRECDGIKAADGHYVNGYAIGNGSWFNDPEGNIMTSKAVHEFGKDGKCIFCRMSKDSKYVDMLQREQYAYEFIHHKPEELLAFLQDTFFKGDRNMKFDIIIGNPPYHLSTNPNGPQATPIYQYFVQNSIALSPKYISMIIPSKWFAGGMAILDSFREQMMADNHVRSLVDYPNAKECFPANSIGGGVCYFLWDRDYHGNCEFTNVSNGKKNTSIRRLDEFPTIVRSNSAVSILRKVSSLKEKTLDLIASPLPAFGLSSKVRGQEKIDAEHPIKLYASNGVSYIGKNEILKRSELVNRYKVMIGILGAEHALEPDSEGKFRVITSSMKVIGPNEVCTHSYFTVGSFDTEDEANSLYSYLRTKFARFLILLAMTSTHLSRNVLVFLPQLEFKGKWTDQMLFERYGLSNDEIDVINSTMKEMN